MKVRKALRYILLMAGMVILASIPSLFHITSESVALVSPLQSMTTTLTQSIYGGSTTASLMSANLAINQSASSNSIKNSTFDYPRSSGPGMYMCGYNNTQASLINDVDPTGHIWLNSCSTTSPWSSYISGFNDSAFGWGSTQGDGAHTSDEQRRDAVELQQDYQTGNNYSEIVPVDPNSSIYQTVSTNKGAHYHWSVQHASQSVFQNDDCAQVIFNGASQQVYRTAVSSGNIDADSKQLQPIGYVGGESIWGWNSFKGTSNNGTWMCTWVSNANIHNSTNTGDLTQPHTSRAHNGQWATYEGDYDATSSSTTFEFHSSLVGTSEGNIIDNLGFTVSYPLYYNMNGGSCTDGSEDCIPATTETTPTSTQKDHNYYTSGTNVSLAGSGSGEDANWSSSGLIKSGYVFLGWSTSQQTYATDYSGGTITSLTMPSSAETVYAVWAPLTNVTWNKENKIDGSFVGGATFAVTAENQGWTKTVVDNGTNDCNGAVGIIALCNVRAYDTYTIKETKAPNGYYNDGNTIVQTPNAYGNDQSSDIDTIYDLPKLNPVIRKYVATAPGGGYNLTLSFTGDQYCSSGSSSSTTQGGCASMTDVVVNDQLTQWVDTSITSSGGGAIVSTTNASGATVSNPSSSISYDASSKQLTWNLGDFTPVDGYTYAITIPITSTQAMLADSQANNYSGPNTGDANTDATGANPAISSGQKGYFTNVNATLTYNVKYTESTNNKWQLADSNNKSLASSSDGILSAGDYYINSALDPTYTFDIPGVDNAGSGTNVNLVAGNAALGNQAMDEMWSFMPQSDGSYMIMNGIGYCLDAYGAGTTDGTQIVQYTCSSSDGAQRFNIKDSNSDGTYLIVPQYDSNMAVSVYSGSATNDTPIQLKTLDTDNVSEQFYLTPITNTAVTENDTYDINVLGNSEWQLDIIGADTEGPGVAAALAGNDLVQQNANGKDQGYNFIRNTDGSYTLKNLLGYCLDISGGSISDNTQVQQYTCNGSNAQKWDIIPDASNTTGAYYIAAYYNKTKVLSVYSGNLSNGQSIKLKNLSLHATGEQWLLTPRNAVKNYNSNISSSNYYAITLAMNPGAVMDVPGIDSCTANDGTCRIATAQSDYRGGQYNGLDQSWQFISNGDGTYTIENRMGRCLDDYGALYNNGNNIDNYNCNGTMAQKWTITYAGVTNNIMIRAAGNTNYALSLYSGVYSGGQNIQLKSANTSDISERFNVMPLSLLGTTVAFNNASQNLRIHDNSQNIQALAQYDADDISDEFKVNSYTGGAGNGLVQFENPNDFMDISENSSSDGASVGVESRGQSSNETWVPVYYHGSWMFKNLESGNFLNIHMSGTNPTVTMEDADNQYRQYGGQTLTYARPVIPGYRLWYKDDGDTGDAYYYDAASDSNDAGAQSFVCAAYVNESVSGTDGYTKGVAGSSSTKETDIGKLKNDSLTGQTFSTWAALTHSATSPNTAEKNAQIIAELNTACTNSNNYANNGATDSSSMVSLNTAMQQAYGKGGILLVTRTKENTVISSPATDLVFYVRPVTVITSTHEAQWATQSPGDGWSTDYSKWTENCDNGGSSVNISIGGSSQTSTCTRTVTGSWQRTDDSVNAIKSAYNGQSQTILGHNSAFRGFYCNTNGGTNNGSGTDADHYINGCVGNTATLSPSYALNASWIHVEHYMMMNILCDKQDFENYRNKVAAFVASDSSTRSTSANPEQDKWQASLISVTSNDQNVVQFPQISALLLGITTQGSNGYITNTGTITNPLSTIGATGTTNDAFVSSYTTAYNASQDPVYTKECPFSCTMDSVVDNTNNISTANTNYSAGSYGFYERASNGQNGPSGDMKSTNSFSSIFYRNNSWNQVALAVEQPSGDFLNNGSIGNIVTTTLLKRSTSTPWNTSTGITNIEQNGSNSATGLFYNNNSISPFTSSTQSIADSSGASTMSGEQNVFKIRSAWASADNRPLQFDISWEYSASDRVKTPTTLGFSANSFASNGARSTENNVANILAWTTQYADVTGRCWYIGNGQGYPDTTAFAHDYSGYDAATLSNADTVSSLLGNQKSGFAVTFVRGLSE